MAIPNIPNDKRGFRCSHCGGTVLVPRNLPPTTGPCPHCSGVITSPPPEPPAQPPSPPASPPETQQPAPIPPLRGSTPPPPPPHKVPAPPAARVPVPPAAGKIASKHARGATPPSKRRLIPVVLTVMLLLLLLLTGIGTVAFLVIREMGNKAVTPATARIGMDPAVMEENYIRIGWQKEAYQVLRDYLAGTSSKDKLPHILHGNEFASRLEDFYGGSVINDSDTPAAAFSVYELPEADRRRGLFMMIYDQPPQFDMKEFFRPLASLEVQYGIEEADLLLSTFGKLDHFAMEPTRVHAFFKCTPSGLKLDWEVFVQTKYRTFQNFVELPEIGLTGVFRVLIVEDVPDKSHFDPETRTYRMADPANTTDTARVNVKVDSEIGRTLSVINWRGARGSAPNTRTATVELAWTGEPDAPVLEISRFICWEFAGLGGEETPVAASTK